MLKNATKTLDRESSKATPTSQQGRISLSQTLKPEIVIGLAGPVGTDLGRVDKVDSQSA